MQEAGVFVLLYHFKLHVMDAILFTLFTGGYMEGVIMKVWLNRKSSNNYLECYKFPHGKRLAA